MLITFVYRPYVGNLLLHRNLTGGSKLIHMQTTIQKPGLKKLFDNKFLTYVVADNNGRGKVVEIEIIVTGRKISYTYTSIRERG